MQADMTTTPCLYICKLSIQQNSTKRETWWIGKGFVFSQRYIWSFSLTTEYLATQQGLKNRSLFKSIKFYLAIRVAVGWFLSLKLESPIQSKNLAEYINQP